MADPVTGGSRGAGQAPGQTFRPVTRGELEAAFGAGSLVRIPAERLPAAVTDPGARAFLSDIGLPDAPSAVVRPAPGLGTAFHPVPGRPGASADGSAGVLLGHWSALPFVLDGVTGAVHAFSPHRADAAGDTRPAHRDLHSLARCLLAFDGEVLWLLADLMDPGTADWCRARHPRFAELCPARAGGDPESGHDPDGEAADGDDFELDEDRGGDVDWPDPDEVLARLTARLEAAEPGVTTHPVWQDVLRHYRYGF